MIADNAGVLHPLGCPAVSDDESDYDYLSDAGECICGAYGEAANEHQ